MAENVKDAHQPTGLFGAELVLAGPAVALAKHVYDAVKEGRPAVSPSDPLFFGVAESVTGPVGHRLTLVCSNLGAHGVYLENVIVADPKQVTATASVPAKKGMSMSFDGSSVSDSVTLPILVPSGGNVVLEVEISPFAEDRMSKKPFGTLNISYTVAGVANTGLTKAVEFSVRRILRKSLTSPS